MKTQEKSSGNALQEAITLVKESGAFDENYYLSQKPNAGDRDLVEHYLSQGWMSGMNPHPCFNTFFYLKNNKDIHNINLHPFIHFLLFGHREARHISQDFYLPDFIEQHPELEKLNINPLKHFTSIYGHEWLTSHNSLMPLNDGNKPLTRQDNVLSSEDTTIEDNSSPDSFSSPYIGRIDAIESSRVSGWVVNLENRLKRLEVEILINGIPYQSKELTLFRPDVENIYPGNPVCGFEFHIPLKKLLIEKISVTVRVKGTQTLILTKSGSHTVLGKATNHPTFMSKATLAKDAYGTCIVVPIYNAPKEVAECIESLLMHTNISKSGHHLILSDDASPDTAVEEILSKYDNNPNITIIRNKKNLGYTGNINQAILAAGTKDVVLLNSDTRVTPNWLELLQRAVLQSKFIGTASAVSDNAGAFSVPKRNTYNPTPSWFDEDEYGRLITHTSNQLHLRIPTTSGFCMYIKHAVFESIGLFDVKTFAKGYGEENDFCMRAGHFGWEHILADNVIVYHERSASFLDNKTALMDRASDLIPEMYPEYKSAIGQSFVQNSELNQRRFDIAYKSIRYPTLPKPRVAYVIGVDSGGTPQTNMDLMSTIQNDYEPYLLLCSTGTLRIFKIQGATRIEVESIQLLHPVMPIQHDSDSYKREITDVLQRYSFELIHIRHIGRHGLSIIPIAKSLNIKVIFSLHDFYTVCPNVKLLDAENRFCGGKCTSGDNDCNVELWDHRFTPKLKHGWIHSWRTIFQRVLSSCDVLITTSPYARDLIKSIYKIKDVRFDVIPHARDFDSFSQIAKANQIIALEKIKVFIPGHIVPAKGLDLIKEVKALDTNDVIEFHFAGISKEDLSKYGISHGTYKREEFSSIVAKIQPHVGGVFSIWPETYSHTLTELWASGLPVITSNYGATGERLREHGGGWIIKDMTAKSIYKLLLKLRNDYSEINKQAKSVVSWQNGYGKNYTIPVMTACYKRVYDQVLSQPHITFKEFFIIPFGAVSSDTPVSTQHINLEINKIYNDCHLSIWPSSVIKNFSKLDAPYGLVIQYHGENELNYNHNDLAKLKKKFKDLKIILDISIDSIVEIIEDKPNLHYLLAKADHIIAPPTMLEANDSFASINLESMKVSSHDNRDLPVPVLAKQFKELPKNTISYADMLIKRMDKEVLSGSSSFVNKHNALYVTANFTLINWNTILTKPKTKGMVSIVIPNFDKVGITEKLLLTLTNVTNYKKGYEVIVMDNGSRPEVRVQVEQFEKIDPRIRVVHTPVPLMFSVGCNYGAAYAKGEFILFLNNDMEVIESQWLEKLIAPLEEFDDIGIVGGKLLYQDRTVQHAGLVFSNQSNMAYHAYLGADKDAPHVNRRQQMQAVTGACLAMRASDFSKLRGFNPLFVNGCEDVDLCLRMQHTLSLRTFYIPESVLIHLEGKSPGRGKYVLSNRKIFSDLWSSKIYADDQILYKSDGFRVKSYSVDNNWLKPEFRSISVKLEKKPKAN
ncbi:glycosyltransferase [Pseudomonas syringae]|nr:glycosyltransferase [Pseudomonas syringae]